ncbi:unnamed protein product [Cyprideis torosa]|uniref:RING-type E3 ubiquitin transferase n=1 Tax=Cyprideis torosa TaxID=163714 RepID=A0A7R8W547_9CRUS|nr:unnamed protein product [Cyprideis torosa]CAG0882516.1 unnamed protein product [Cyprideis torosa]
MDEESSASSSPKTEPRDEEKDKKEDAGSLYECNICLDTARDAVVSNCGHLFWNFVFYSWPCLHTWLETRPARPVCPVCKAGISKDKVIPIYGRGDSKREDPREKLPPRPPGQRSEPEFQPGHGFGFGEGFQMSFGIGAFPFGFFASSFNFGDQRPQAANPGTAQHLEEQYLSKLFLYVAIFFLIWIILM